MATPCVHCGSATTADGTCAACSEISSPAQQVAQQAIESPSISKPERLEWADVPAAPPTFTTDSDLKGIGGWLIPTMLGLAIGPLFQLRGIYHDLRILYGSQFHSVLAARHGLAVLILFEAATNAVMLMALLGLNVLFYKTKKSFPRWMITYFLAAFVITLCDHIAIMAMHTTGVWTAVLQRLVAAVVWIPYFITSRRVEQTFVD